MKTNRLTVHAGRFLLAWWLILAAGSAAHGAADRPVLLCPRTSVPPCLDGQIQDACWQTAGHIGNYLASRGDRFAVEPTETWVCFDATNLYIACKCYDAHMDEIKAVQTRRDENVFTDDCAEVFLDPDLTRRYCFHFIVNALGTQMDAQASEYYDVGWNADWKAKTYRGNGFWSVEVAVPFSAFGLKAAPVGQRWGVNFNREQQRRRELSGWAPTGEAFLNVRRFGDLVFTDKPGISVILDAAGDEPNGARLTVGGRLPQLQVRLNTLSQDGLRAGNSRLIDAGEYGRAFGMSFTYAPSWGPFTFNVSVMNPKDQALLYQSPPFPLPRPLQQAETAKARLEIGKLSGDMAVVKAGKSTSGYLLTPRGAFDIPMPDEIPDPDRIGKTLSVQAAPGECRPAGLLIYTAKTLKNVRIRPSAELTDGAKRIGRECLDLMAVKVWYQAGTSSGIEEEAVLVPELLLKQDNLVSPDPQTKRNRLNFKDRPVDPASLMPFDISAYTNKQVWLNIKVPPTAKPGLYRGKLTVEPENAPAEEIPLELDVLDIQLRKPKVNYSIYYYNRVHVDNDLISKSTYEAELKDMAERGFTSVSILEGVRLLEKDGRRRVDMTRLKQALDLRVKYGLTAPTVYWGYHWETPQTDAIMRKSADGVTPADQETIAFLTHEIVQMIKANPRYPELYFYAIDEPGYDTSGKQLDLCAKFCQAVQNGGGKTITAINRWGANRLGTLLDVAVLDEPTVDLAYQKNTRPKDHRPEWGYWHPLENPTHDRLRFGLTAWKVGLDGVAPFAYQSLGKAAYGWDDWNTASQRYRTMNYTYPACGGFVSTVQWEAVRAGIEDARYLTTLAFWIDQARRHTPSADLQKTLRQAESLLSLPPRFHNDFTTLDDTLTTADFEEFRSQVSKSILALQRHLRN